ncbi:protoporphyrinogen/coproporphyrinogen oxidase [Maribacter sp. 2-571]|uniref:protoporphyrinogen/coproporphyrinogen oxidase n=1 Tax=Maribacter sp. 2-571 TaxID=3417569 RepID=UPI003D3524B3
MAEISPKIAIIGAGLSGLVAAITLEKKGYRPTIYEASDSIGGRVKTDIVNGIPIDHGFQVLLTAYPAAQKYLDYEDLQLQHFLPGSLLLDGQNRSKIGDPLRDIRFLVPTVFSKVGSLRDKWKIFKLSNSLKKMSIQEVFEGPDESTLSYLQGYGFSAKMIDTFFLPFFSGIFLEDALATSAKMFRFVYKMFSEGSASVPKNGMQEIPAQLRAQLKHTTIVFNSTVANVEGNTLEFSQGNKAEFDLLLIATDPTSMLPQLVPTPVTWQSTETLYFKLASTAGFKAPIIGLVTDKDSLINNVHFVTDVLPGKRDRAVLSVTIVAKHSLSETEKIDKVKKELAVHCGFNEITLIKSYRIDQALPILKTPTYDSRIGKYTDTIYLAGDYLANGSINAAMLSGETAAKEMITAMETVI